MAPSTKRGFLFIAASFALIGTAMVSSTVSVRPAVKESRTHYLHVEGPSTVPFIVYSYAAMDNCQVFEIPGGPLMHVETAETLKQAEPSKVLAVANSPPVV